MDHDTDPEMSATDTILKVFRSQTSKRLRWAMCQSILNELDHNEWRRVKELAATKSTHFDILPYLPTEILLEVVRWLPLKDLLRCHEVSTIWQSRLSSTSVYTTALEAHGVYPPKDSTSDELRLCFEHWVERLDRLRRNDYTGRDLNKDHNMILLETFDYAYGRCVLSTAERRVLVKDLREGVWTNVPLPNRELIIDARISDVIVVVITRPGYCIAYDLLSGENRSFRLPSLAYEFLSVENLTVAIGFKRSVLIWSFTTGSVRAIPVRDGMVYMALNTLGSRLSTVHFAGDNETSETPVPASESNPPTRLLHVEHALDREDTEDATTATRVKTKCLDLPIVGGINRARKVKDVTPMYTKRLRLFKILSDDDDVNKDNPQHHFFLFTLSSTPDGDMNLEVLHIVAPFSRFLAVARVALNVVHYIADHNERFCSEQRRVCSKDVGEACIRVVGEPFTCEQPPMEADPEPCVLIGDADFVVCAKEGVLDIASYDGTVFARPSAMLGQHSFDET